MRHIKSWYYAVFISACCLCTGCSQHHSPRIENLATHASEQDIISSMGIYTYYARQVRMPSLGYDTHRRQCELWCMFTWISIMKQRHLLNTIIVLLFVICCTTCLVVEPIEPQNTYSIDNLTQKDVKVVYTILPEFIFWEHPAQSFTDSCFVFANTRTQIPLNKYGFYVSECPSRLFERIVILSIENDT